MANSHKINPLEVQTSSNTFSMVIELIASGLTKGAVIGIGNDIGLWSNISCMMDELLIFESDSHWLGLCQDYSYNLISKLKPKRNRCIKFIPFLNEIYVSAQAQAKLLAELHEASYCTLIKEIQSLSLYKTLNTYQPDWIYVDGPLGGYWDEMNFQIEPNRGRYESIFSSALCLQTNACPNKLKWLIVDDCHRFIEKKTLSVLSPLLNPIHGLPLTRNTLAFQINPGNKTIHTKRDYISITF